MEASRNDPGAGMRQGRGSNERSGEQHDRKHTPTQATVQSTSRIAEHTGPTKSTKPAAPLRIVIEPTTSGRKWTARFNDRVLCRSAWSFFKSARVLLAEGHPADAVVEMWRRTPTLGRCAASSARSPQPCATARRRRFAPSTGCPFAFQARPPSDDLEFLLGILTDAIVTITTITVNKGIIYDQGPRRPSDQESGARH